ncbi:aldo/keto reductase [bacterium C-53]|nr:aldo/keto reductase [Lachnospiraceae bacterium]NBI02355.1 aldo/keto reductase [Lachnospiraceae bacterium]RKJ11909.1 aldo/keto reductase [bacterium C-53]
MNYRKNKKGEDVSLLGFGCMRWTRKGGRIDIEKAEKEVLKAVESGVNYFDTAYVYTGNEAALGEILKRNPGLREKINIATKLPHYLIKSKAGMEKMFQEELRRLGTDYIDYYLMHMLTDTDTWKNLCDMGVLDWILEKKRSGKIRNIGFSYHGHTEVFCNLIDVYDWDFCQIQYNYMDEHSQAGRKGLRYAAKKGIPVIIMEPLRGGRLVSMLPNEAKKIFSSAAPERTPAEWAFRWLYNQPEVTCVLSGMNSLAMVEENVRIASDTEPGSMTDEEMQVFEQVKEAISGKIRVNCTGCGYCMPCPKGVDIPGTFRCLNEIYTESRGGARREYLMTTAFRKNKSAASQCVKCGKCEKHCPQAIEIRKELSAAVKELETPVYKIASKGISLLKLW